LIVASQRGQLMEVALIFIVARCVGMRGEGFVNRLLTFFSLRIALFERQFRASPGKSEEHNQANDTREREDTSQAFSQMQAQQTPCPGGAFPSDLGGRAI